MTDDAARAAGEHYAEAMKVRRPMIENTPEDPAMDRLAALRESDPAAWQRLPSATRMGVALYLQSRNAAKASER